MKSSKTESLSKFHVGVSKQTIRKNLFLQNEPIEAQGDCIFVSIYSCLRCISTRRFLKKISLYFFCAWVVANFYDDCPKNRLVEMWLYKACLIKNPYYLIVAGFREVQYLVWKSKKGK